MSAFGPASGEAAAHPVGSHPGMRAAGESATVIATSETTPMEAAIGTAAVEATATTDVSATAATMAAAMLGNCKLRGEYECCRRNAGEKYLQYRAIPHIYTLRQSVLALVWQGGPL